MSWIVDYFDAWNRKDAEAVAAFTHDDVEFRDMAFGIHVVGRDNIAGFVRESYEAAPDMQFELVASAAGDDHYWAEWVWQPVGIPGVSIGTLRDGKILMNHDYWDRSRLKRSAPSA